MKRLSPNISRLTSALVAAVALLWVLMLNLPTPGSADPVPPSFAEVRLKAKLEEPSLPEVDLPFLAQDEPETQEPDNPDARTADAYNRRVDKETMARRSQPAKIKSKPSSVTPKASQAKPNQLELALDFLGQKPNGSSIDLFDLPDQVGGPRLPQLDVAAGDRTWLSSRSVRYGGFFRRLHTAISRQWDPASALQRRDPTGLLYGTQDRQTVLRLRLNESGYLLEQPQIISGSGLRLLDQEAIRAVVAAAPFSNPPRALLRNGVIDLHRFSFYFEIDRSRFYLRRD